MILGMPSVPAPPPPEPTPEETREFIIRASGRGYVVLRQNFVQLDDSHANRASVLGSMVSDRKHRALVLYLLLLTIWPHLESLETPLTSRVWRRALTTTKGPLWSRADLSKTWTQLEDELNLITRSREGRLQRIKPLMEVGGKPYVKPSGEKKNWSEAYSTLPAEFWLDEWFAKLSLAELAVLLIVAKETTRTDEMWVTESKVAKWYGISPNTLRKGVHGLQGHGLLKVRPEHIRAPLSPSGYTTRHYYSLTGPFSRSERRKAQAAAERSVKAKNAATSTGAAPSAPAPAPAPAPKKTTGSRSHE